MPIKLSEEIDRFRTEFIDIRQQFAEYCGLIVMMDKKRKIRILSNEIRTIISIKSLILEFHDRNLMLSLNGDRLKYTKHIPRVFLVNLSQR